MSTFEESVETTFDTARILSGQGAKRDDVAKWIANVLEQSFLIIDRDELPTATIIQRDGKDHVEVDGSDAGTWPISSNHENVRRWGLEYLVAAELIAKARAERNAADAKRANRRDELAEKFAPGARWSRLSAVTQRAIDYAIELEGKK